jgi:L-lactate dehydrogenase (cytochrome)
LAYEKGANGILISNHGGRQLDTTRPTPASISNPERLTPDDDTSEKASKPFEIYVDGGINRGTDVVKALCLGANAVGVGRGFLYAQSVAGTEGVKHAVGSESNPFAVGALLISVLESEILLALRLLGANKLDDLRPSMVEVKDHPGV